MGEDGMGWIGLDPMGSDARGENGITPVKQ